MEQNTTTEKRESGLPPIRSLMNEAWVLYKSRWETYVSISLLLIAFSLAFTSASGWALHVVVSLLYLVLGIFTQAAILGNATKSENIGFLESVKYAARNFDKYLWITVLTVLITLAGVVLIIPAIIWSITFTFAMVVLAAEGTKGMDALLASREQVRGRWINVFVTLIVFQLILFFIPSIIFTILNINGLNTVYAALALPLSTIYTYVLYKYLKSTRSVLTHQDLKKFFITMAVCGILVLGAFTALGIIFKDILREKGVFEEMRLSK